MWIELASGRLVNTDLFKVISLFFYYGDHEHPFEIRGYTGEHDDVWWGLENFSNKEEAEQEFEKIKAKLLAEQ